MIKALANFCTNGKLAISVCIIVFLSGCKQYSEKRPVDFVNPFIGTGGHGHTYPGVSLPFGMVQLSPDTRLDGWDGCSGYHHSDSIIYGFSHTHLSGTGCSDYGDILIMPTNGSFHWNNSEYASHFSHKNEIAKAGFYSVLLEKYNIKVELTATLRAGFHRYIYSEGEQSNILIDLKHRDKVIDSYIKIVNNCEIEGYRRSEAWAADQQVFFVAKFSKNFDKYEIAVNDSSIGNTEKTRGSNLKGFFSFKVDNNDTILVKVAISGVSIENARQNLENEITDWDFEKIVKKADSSWNNELRKIEITGGSNKQKTIFYTSLYHAFLSPNIYSDINVEYRGRDFKVHKENFDYYTVFSLWDTYRAAHPLFTITQQKRTVDFINTFIKQYEQGGLLPVWELSSNETGCMIGYHAVPVIVDAYMKGIRGFDVEKAYLALKASAEQDKLGLSSYKKFGVIFANQEGESVSKLLEYAYDDWCIAQMAKALNKLADYKLYTERAQSYKNLLDPSSGFMRARMQNFWFAPFDPAEVNFNYTEANAWQYSFYVPHDIENFVKYIGGKEKFSDKLDALFNANSKTTGRNQADITGLIGQYAHGNEPSHHIAYLYNFSGKPWKTQQIVKKIQNEMYSEMPDGLCGNEDCGQMSAWHVMSALGFYPVTPGTIFYVIGTPLFKEVKINLENGKKFIIIANNISEKNIYIKSAKLNGRDYNKSYLSHFDVINGGELVFEMSSEPSKTWGVGDENEPITSIDEHLITPMPFIYEGKPTFLNEQTIKLGCLEKDADIYFTTDGTIPTKKSKKYNGQFKITETVTVKAIAVRDGFPESKIMVAEINKIPEGRKISIKYPYANQYSAGGDMALIDMIKGGENFKTGTWQGYEGVDLYATVELKEKQSLNEISAGFLQDMVAWIFFPSKVEFWISEDGKNFSLAETVVNNTPLNEKGAIVKKFFTKKVKGEKAKFIRVIATNIKVCPPWHLGAGGKAWIFADEITIK